MARILIGCEFSARVRDALNAAGHDAWSCDLRPTKGRQSNHLVGDVRWALEGALHRFDAIDMRTGRRPIFRLWDAAIFFPDCTYLTNSAEWAFGDGPYHQKVKPGTLVGAARRKAREEALTFVADLLNAPIPMIALENPRGVISTRIRKPDQIIQPHWFGDDASKATCLWLKNLPPLKPTMMVAPRMVDGRPRWANQTDSGQNRLPPTADRAAIRSTTYPGIAAAMGSQWGSYIRAHAA